MSDQQKIEFLLELLRTEKFEMDLARAHAFVQSYKFLLDKQKELESKE
jgi:hypothetical protein